MIDTLLALLCAPFTLIPGPNLPAYYFVFRAVGHFLAMRGAQHGLSRITWTYRASAPLASMRAAVALDADARAAEVEHVGAQLGLERSRVVRRRRVRAPVVTDPGCILAPP